MCTVIRDNLKAAQSRQKSYYDSKHRDLAFEIRDHVYIVIICNTPDVTFPICTPILAVSGVKL